MRVALAVEARKVAENRHDRGNWWRFLGESNRNRREPRCELSFKLIRLGVLAPVKQQFTKPIVLEYCNCIVGCKWAISMSCTGVELLNYTPYTRESNFHLAWDPIEQVLALYRFDIRYLTSRYLILAIVTLASELDDCINKVIRWLAAALLVCR